MIIRTRVFELCDSRYQSLTELAHVMRLSVSQIYRVKEGKRSINQKFIIGAKLAFPNCGLDELFYLELDGDCACAAYPDGNHARKRAELVTSRYLHIVKCFMESA